MNINSGIWKPLAVEYTKASLGGRSLSCGTDGSFERHFSVGDGRGLHCNSLVIPENGGINTGRRDGRP